MALMVVVTVTWIAPEYVAEALVGVVPLVV
jgi:hypothetical protein